MTGWTTFAIGCSTNLGLTAIAALMDDTHSAARLRAAVDCSVKGHGRGLKVHGDAAMVIATATAANGSKDV